MCKPKTLNVRPLNPLKDCKATIVTQTLASHNFPTNRARELIKHSTDLASLRLEIEKQIFCLDFGFFVFYVTMRECLGNFHPNFPGPGPQANAKFFSLNVFVESWLENESSEPLIDFLAYLDGKVWLKNQTMVKILLPQTLI